MRAGLLISILQIAPTVQPLVPILVCFHDWETPGEGYSEHPAIVVEVVVGIDVVDVVEVVVAAEPHRPDSVVLLPL